MSNSRQGRLEVQAVQFDSSRTETFSRRLAIAQDKKNCHRFELAADDDLDRPIFALDTGGNHPF